MDHTLSERILAVPTTLVTADLLIGYIPEISPFLI
jgi:hypothetical protein